MKITKHMQSCFLIETKESRILIDPGSFVFNEEEKRPENFIDISLLIITHPHFDHFDWDNIQRIIEQNNPVVLSTAQTIETIKEKYPNSDCRIVSTGFKQKIGDVEIEGFDSEHGPLPTGKPIPKVCGVVIDDGENRFYTPGDSIFLDEKTRADIVAVPICGQVVMNIEEAKGELLKLKPKLAIPIHYDNPKFPVKVGDFIGAMGNTGIQVEVLKNGESLAIAE